ncbi:DUF6233 domain-containing protein [Streptomyces sp. NPDC086669]|uniref:DUF6233 domain-containing protein n=1 Tax=Streptomyces sp. NPDC086669 TaxID=3365753 RepID=UPI0037F219E4
MNDRVPSRIEMLRFVERVQVADLERTRRWIAEEERREAEQQRGLDARPPQPDWMLEGGLSRDAPPVYVHAGGCHMAGKRVKGVPRDVALRALTEGIDACPHCRPDSELGFLD